MSILALPSVGIAAAAAADLLPAVAFAKLSGEDDPHRLADIAAHDLAARDLLFTFSVMCSPANPEDWLRLNNALTDDELYHAIRHAERLGIPSSVKGDVALGIADREELRSILDQMFAKDWLGHVASGYILRWIISRWQNPATKNDASLTRAASIIEEWCKQQCIAGGGSQNLVRYLWPKYKSVSHLWAAFYIAQDIGDQPGDADRGFVLFWNCRMAFVASSFNRSKGPPTW